LRFTFNFYRRFVLQLPKSPKKPTQFHDVQIWYFQCQSITNYFVGVMNDVIFKIEFLKFTLFIIFSNEFGRVLNSTHFGDTLHSNLLFLSKNFISVPIAPKVPISPKTWHKTFRNIGPRVFILNLNVFIFFQF
jgi:hypothetical protein